MRCADRLRSSFLRKHKNPMARKQRSFAPVCCVNIQVNRPSGLMCVHLYLQEGKLVHPSYQGVLLVNQHEPLLHHSFLLFRVSSCNRKCFFTWVALHKLSCVFQFSCRRIHLPYHTASQGRVPMVQLSQHCTIGVLKSKAVSFINRTLIADTFHRIF